MKNPINRISKTIGFILFFFQFEAAYSQVSTDNVKATLLLHFCENVTWQKPLPSTFTIGFYSDNDVLYNIIQNQVVGKVKIQGKNIVAKQISKMHEMLDCQAIYYKKTEYDGLNTFFKNAQNNNILLITDNFDEQLFVMINMIQNKDKISFKVNIPNLTLSGFTVKPNLLLNGGSLVDIKEAYDKFDKQLQDSRQKLESSRVELTKTESLLQQKDLTIKQKEITLKQKESEISNYKNDIELIKQESNKLNIQVVQKQSLITGKEYELQKKDTQLKNIYSDINIKLKELTNLRENIKSLKTESDTLKTVIEEKNVVVNRQEKYISSQRNLLLVSLGLIGALFLAAFALIRLFLTKKKHNKELEEKVLLRTKELQKRTDEYLSLFNLAPVAILEMNFSEIKRFFDSKDFHSQDDYLNYAQNNPEFLKECFRLRTISTVNKASLDLFKVQNIDEIHELYDYIFEEGMASSVIDEFTFLLTNEHTRTYEAIRYNKEKEKINVSINWIDISETPNSYERILLTMFDITRIRAIERELLKYQEHLELLVQERTNEIGTLNEELNSQNEELLTTNEVLESTNEALAQSNFDLKEANDELNIQKAKLKSALEELQNAQMQMIQSEKLASLGILTAGVAHEINNPLNFIQTGLYALEEKIKELNAVSDDIEVIETILSHMNVGVQRASAIVKSLNTFSRKDTHTIKECDIHQIIENSLLILNHEIKNKCTVIKQYETRPFIVNGNEENLHQVFLNIINNSVQAMKTKGDLTISTILKDTFLHITIQDNGEGISADNLKKIFDPFFTTKDPGKGIGLGLSIVYKIINEHKGTIQYNSELNKGTCVTIDLPIKKTDKL